MFYLICTYTAKKLAQPRRKNSTDASAPSARFSISGTLLLNLHPIMPLFEEVTVERDVAFTMLLEEVQGRWLAPS